MADNAQPPELREALQAWATEAVALLREAAAELMRRWPGESWQLGEDGTYRRGQFAQIFLTHNAVERITDLPTYAGVKQAAYASPVVGPMLGQLVGTAMERSLVDLWHVAQATLPPLEDIVNGTDSGSFEVRYSETVAALTRTQATYETICFLQGVTFAIGQFELEPGLTIAKLTAAEVATALDVDLLTPMLGSVPIYQIQEGASFALKRVAHVPQFVGTEISDEQRAEAMRIQDMSEDAEIFLQCLALLSSERIDITGQLGLRTDVDMSILRSGRSLRHYPAPRSFAGAGYRMDGDQCTELQNIWRIAHDERFPQNKALSLALRRLGFATQRDRPEDRLLDIFIASEAFYLTDPGEAKERGELRYRLALRAAVWSEGTLDDWTKQEVLQHMKRGYDVRSTIAHGGTLKLKDLKIKGQPVDLPTFVNTTEQILRAALYKAFCQVTTSGQLPTISWDDLILHEHRGNVRPCAGAPCT